MSERFPIDNVSTLYTGLNLIIIYIIILDFHSFTNFTENEATSEIFLESL